MAQVRARKIFGVMSDKDRRETDSPSQMMLCITKLPASTRGHAAEKDFRDSQKVAEAAMDYTSDRERLQALLLFC